MCVPHGENVHHRGSPGGGRGVKLWGQAPVRARRVHSGPATRQACGRAVWLSERAKSCKGRLASVRVREQQQMFSDLFGLMLWPAVVVRERLSRTARACTFMCLFEEGHPTSAASSRRRGRVAATSRRFVLEGAQSVCLSCTRRAAPKRRGLNRGVGLALRAGGRGMRVRWR